MLAQGPLCADCRPAPLPMMEQAPQKTTTPAERDRFVDFVRALSLVVVVVWHWAFTILRWESDGPHATNPIGFTKGMWLVTWVMQVMPLFFFVGGWANLSAWRRAKDRGANPGSFAFGRVKDLLLPAFGLIGVWYVLLLVVTWFVEASWLKGATLLVLSPLWFAFTYAVVIAAFPLWLRLHERFGILVPVWLAGVAAVVDIARFAHDVPHVGWLNMLVVWGLAHQLGFFYRDLIALPRRAQQAMAWSGCFGLVALVWSKIYPGSMVGVPGDKFSNMAPPSLAIVALVVLQVGLLLLVRDWVMSRLLRPRWERFTRLLTTYSMPLYLLHSSGLAIYLVGLYLINGRMPLDSDISWRWWATRPLAVTLPLLTTAPLIWAVGRLAVTGRRAATQVVDAVSDAADAVSGAVSTVTETVSDLFNRDGDR